MIDICEELANVTLEYPASARIVFAHDIGERLKAVHCGVGSFPVATGERVGDERFIEKWIELAINRMVDEAVAHARFMNVAWLGIGYFECLIAAVTIRPIYQIGVK